MCLRSSRASQAAGNHARAIQDFETYLKEYPKGADHDEARFHLGEAQLAAGQAVAARMTFTDIARPLESDAAKRTQEQSDLMARVVTVRVLHEVDGTRQVVSHFNKATKGRLVRALLEDGRDARTPAAFASLLADLGWNNEQVLDLGGVATATGPEAYGLLFLGIFTALKSPTFNIAVIR